MEPAVERIRAEVEQVKGAMGEIEARRETVDDVQPPPGRSGRGERRAQGAHRRRSRAGWRPRRRGSPSSPSRPTRPSSSPTPWPRSPARSAGRAPAGGGGRVGAGARGPHPAARRAGGADPAPRPGARAAAGRARQGHRAPRPASALRQEAAETAQRLEELDPRRQLARSRKAEERSGALSKVTGELETPGHRAQAGRAAARRSSRSCWAVGVGPGARPPRGWSRPWPVRQRSRRSRPRSSTCSSWPSARWTTCRRSARPGARSRRPARCWSETQAQFTCDRGGAPGTSRPASGSSSGRSSGWPGPKRSRSGIRTTVGVAPGAEDRRGPRAWSRPAR